MKSAGAVRQEILDAFASVPYPGDGNITEGGTGEAVEVSEIFRGKHWREWIDRSIELVGVRNSGFLSFLAPPAFRYYLPLAMIATLDHYREVDRLPESIVSHLSPSREKGIEDAWWRARIGLFKPAELCATIAFLRFIAAAHSEDHSGALQAEFNAAIAALESRLPAAS